jgi:hypothetical protein
MCPHHRVARIANADVVSLCVLASPDSPRCTISTKPFSRPYQLVFRSEHCLVLAQCPDRNMVVIASPPARFYPCCVGSTSHPPHLSAARPVHVRLKKLLHWLLAFLGAVLDLPLQPAAGAPSWYATARVYCCWCLVLQGDKRMTSQRSKRGQTTRITLSGQDRRPLQNSLNLNRTDHSGGVMIAWLEVLQGHTGLHLTPAQHTRAGDYRTRAG